MIELRENGVLISNNDGRNVNLIRYSEISGAFMFQGSEACPPHDLTLYAVGKGGDRRVELREFGNPHEDYDAVMAKVNRFIADVMDRCAGAKVKAEGSANGQTVTLPFVEKKSDIRRTADVWREVAEVAGQDTEKLRTQLDKLLAANRSLQADVRDWEECAKTAEVKVAELEKALAASETSRDSLQKWIDQLPSAYVALTTGGAAIRS